MLSIIAVQLYCSLEFFIGLKKINDRKMLNISDTKVGMVNHGGNDVGS